MFIHRQNHKNIFLIFILICVLLFSFYLSFYHENFNVRLLRNLTTCPPRNIQQPQKSLKQSVKSSNIVFLLEKQLMQHTALSRAYGEFFKVPKAVIRKATENEQLRSDVKNILEMDTKPTAFISKTQPSLVNNLLKIDINWNIINPGSKVEKSYFTEKADCFQTSSQLSGVTKGIRNLRPTQQYDFTFPVNAKISISNLKALFLKLTGESVEEYLKKKMSWFRNSGALNLWKYLVSESSNYTFTDLERTSVFASNFNAGILCLLCPARTSVDGRYLLYDSLITGSEFVQQSQMNKVTVTTQTSMDRLPTFVDSYRYWKGPISLAIFLRGPMEYFVFLSYISFMERCFPQQFGRTRFNIATPTEDPIPGDVTIQTTDFNNIDCLVKSSVIKALLRKKLIKSIEWLKWKWYPQNMMRNFARHNIVTDYQITLDVDIIPCPKMSERLNTFLNTSYEYKNALVVPTYEVSTKAAFPQTKNELVRLAKKRMAQPFHKDVYLPNQNATNFPKWEKIYDSFEPVHIVHEIQNFPMHYEPFFIEFRSSPIYDESFVGYGFTRSSHAYEMFFKYGNFLVLSPVYTAQLGIIKVKQWSDARQQQNEYNRRRFDIFLKNIRKTASTIENTVVTESMKSTIALP